MKRRWAWLILLLLILGGAVTYWWRQSWLERSQDGPIRAATRRYGVEPALVKAVVWRESHFHPRARGRAEEIGLMQLREEAAREWASAEHLLAFEHEQRFDPGTREYVRSVMRRYAHYRPILRPDPP